MIILKVNDLVIQILMRMHRLGDQEDKNGNDIVFPSQQIITVARQYILPSQLHKLKALKNNVSIVIPYIFLFPFPAFEVFFAAAILGTRRVIVTLGSSCCSTFWVVTTTSMASTSCLEVKGAPSGCKTKRHLQCIQKTHQTSYLCLLFSSLPF